MIKRPLAGSFFISWNGHFPLDKYPASGIVVVHLIASKQVRVFGKQLLEYFLRLVRDLNHRSCGAIASQVEYLPCHLPPLHAIRDTSPLSNALETRRQLPLLRIHPFSRCLLKLLQSCAVFRLPLNAPIRSPA